MDRFNECRGQLTCLACNASKFLLSTLLTLLLIFSPHQSVAAESPIDRDILALVDLVYDLQFSKGLEAAKTLQERYPLNPAGFFYEGVVYYQQNITENPPQKSTFQSFQVAMDRCTALAKSIDRSDPVTSHQYQGAALGFQARYLASQHHFLAALPKARQAVQHVQKAIELNPNLTDAYLGMGMYNYFTATMPIAAKPLAYLLIGLWGNREKGLAYLERVARDGSAARYEARSVLSSIYSSDNERLWGKADKILDELMVRYPHNSLYALRKVKVLRKMGYTREANTLEKKLGPAALTQLPDY
jgi:tetratricopeptide (TPR) repeat protein